MKTGPATRDRLGVRGVDRRDVVSVDLDRVPAVRSRTPREQITVPLVHRGASLAEPVHVEDRHQVVEPVERRRFHRLPHRALGRLGVAHQHEDPAAAAVEAHRESTCPARPRVPGPSEPVATSIHGSSGTGAGWPWIGDPKRRRLSSCSSEMAPIAFSVEYSAGAACPFDMTNRSLASDRGSSTSVRRWLAYRTASRWAHDSDEVGCPIPPRSCTGCCRRRSGRQGRSRVGCGRPSSPRGTRIVREAGDRSLPAAVA